MTAFVSLLFIAMIPIDCKITNFSLHLFIYFFSKNYNIGELTSATSKERMTTNITFMGATPIDERKFHMSVSFVFVYACPVAKCYRQRKA